MEINRHNLPDDPAALQQMVTGLLEELEARERRLRQLQHWVEQLLRYRYGPKRERVSENQLFLFAVTLLSAGEENAPVAEKPETSPPQRAGHGRQRLPKTLERRRVIYDLAEQERQCPECQRELKLIGEEVSERLEYVPASLQVIEEACQKYACSNGCAVVTAQKPMQPIEKGLPGPGLLAHVAVSKYSDHLPLYRQEGIFQRYGVMLSRRTMCDWMDRCAQLVRPLFELMKHRVLTTKVMQTDIVDPGFWTRQ